LAVFTAPTDAIGDATPFFKYPTWATLMEWKIRQNRPPKTISSFQTKD
jgi:hypothetical protein